jgi:RNA polymerase sigma-70 factor, ECF subfamily
LARQRIVTTEDAADTAILARMAAGDQPAFARLYDRYSGLLLAVGIRMLGRAEAEDVLHDVFVEVWKRAGDFDPSRGSARGWLAMRMRSRCLDRKKSPRLSRSITLDAAEQARQAAPEQDPLLRMQRQRVRAAVSTLGPDHWMVVDLTYFVGLSTQEIGTQLGIPQGTVKSRLLAAREKLALALDTDAEGAR